MYTYIFWVDHAQLGKMNITMQANSREQAMQFAENCQDFRSWEYRGVVAIKY